MNFSNMLFNKTRELENILMSEGVSGEQLTIMKGTLYEARMHNRHVCDSYALTNWVLDYQENLRGIHYALVNYDIELMEKVI